MSACARSTCRSSCRSSASTSSGPWAPSLKREEGPSVGVAPREPVMTIDAPLYPVNLVLDGRPCLVVGGGSVAARKVAGLVACGARVHVVAPELTPEVTAMAGVTTEQRPYERGEAARY